MQTRKKNKVSLFYKYLKRYTYNHVDFSMHQIGHHIIYLKIVAAWNWNHLTKWLVILHIFFVENYFGHPNLVLFD